MLFSILLSVQKHYSVILELNIGTGGPGIFLYINHEHSIKELYLSDYEYLYIFGGQRTVNVKY